MRTSIKLVGVALGAVLLSGTLYVTADSADKAQGTKVAHVSTRQPTNASRIASTEPVEYVFGAPPAGTYNQRAAIYRPIADFLTRVTGKHFVYRPSDNWLSYSRDMTRGDYDLVFDSAALNSWRIERIEHTPILRLAGDTSYVVVTRADQSKIEKLEQLAGRRVCAPQPPAVATLTLLSQFDNPARQPVIAETNGWSETYRKLAQGKCAGGIMPRKYLNKIDHSELKVLYRHGPLPNPALSAGPRVSPQLRNLIRQALLTPQGKLATAKLRAAHDGADLIPARGQDYAGLGKLLKNSVYYY